MQPLAGAVPAEPSAVLSASEWLCAPLVGVSQIFVVNDPLAGAMMLGAIASYSPQCAGFTLLGSTLGLGTGLLLGAPAAELGMGLWGFNPALTSLAVSVFFVANPVRARLRSNFNPPAISLPSPCHRPAISLQRPRTTPEASPSADLLRCRMPLPLPPTNSRMPPTNSRMPLTCTLLPSDDV